jgi:hypothetical protein
MLVEVERHHGDSQSYNQKQFDFHPGAIII